MPFCFFHRWCDRFNNIFKTILFKKQDLDAIQEDYSSESHIKNLSEISKTQQVCHTTNFVEQYLIVLSSGQMKTQTYLTLIEIVCGLFGLEICSCPVTLMNSKYIDNTIKQNFCLPKYSNPIFMLSKMLTLLHMGVWGNGP